MHVSVKWIDGVSFVGESETGHAVVLDGAPENGGRNIGMRPMEMLLIGMGGCTSVSYTHLDVYKRQVQSKVLFCSKVDANKCTSIKPMPNPNKACFSMKKIISSLSAILACGKLSIKPKTCVR